MNDTERFLRERWFAKRAIGRLMMDLSMAKAAYQQSFQNACVTCDITKARNAQRSSLSPVEYSAILVVDHYRAEMESIEKRLAAERRKIAMVEQALGAAGLEQREEEYVRLRYFENRSVEATAQRLYCSVATCGRVRESAIKKIEQRGLDKGLALSAPQSSAAHESAVKPQRILQSCAVREAAENEDMMSAQG